VNAATHIGRVGGVAAALGVGAALLSGTAVAWADRGQPDASGWFRNQRIIIAGTEHRRAQPRSQRDGSHAAGR
jgi:hypothetical protein